MNPWNLLELNDLSRWAPIAWTQFWQVTVLVAAVGLLARLLGDRARLLWSLWLLVLAKCLVPPLWSSPLGLFSWAQTAADPARVVHPMTDPFDLHAGNTAADRWLPWLAMAWMVGVAVIGIRWLSARRRLHRLVAGSTSPPHLQRIAHDVGQGLGLKRPVRVAVIEASVGPAVGGLLRPYVLLPRTVVNGVAESDLRILLCHELLHVRRGDLWLSLLQSLAAALWWFHPAVRWASRRLDDATERCVDQDVIDRIRVPPQQYVASLLSVLEVQSGHQAVWSLPGVRRAELTRDRMLAVLGARPVNSPRSAARGAALVLGALMLLPGRVQRFAEPPVPECCRVSRAPRTTERATDSQGNSTNPAELMQQ